MNRPWASRLPAAGRAGLLDYRVLIVLLLAPSVSFGQTAVNYTEKLTVEDGLSGQLITDVAQDGRGFLWISSTNGLNRYDGSEVVPFMADGKPGSLLSNGVNCLLPQGKDRLLMGTDKGIAVLDLNNFTFRNFRIAAKGDQHQHADQVFHLVRDFLGQYWASTLTAVYRLDSNLAVLDVFQTQADPMSSRNSNVGKILPLETGITLIWARSGRYLWSGKGKGLQPMDQEDGPLFQFLLGDHAGYFHRLGGHFVVALSGTQLKAFDLVNNRIFDLSLEAEDDPSFICSTWKNSVAICSSKGEVRVYELSGTASGPALKLQCGPLPPVQGIQRVLEDDGEDLWVATSSQGLVKVSAGKQRFHHLTLPEGGPDRASTKEIASFFPLGQTMLVGTYGSGFYQMDPASGALRNFSVRLGPRSENMALGFVQMSADTLWVATQQGMMIQVLGSFHYGRLPEAHPALLDSVPISTIYKDGRGWVWIGLGAGNGVAVYDGNKETFRVFPYTTGEYPYRYPTAIREDARGDLWMASDITGNLVRWDHLTGRFIKVAVPGIDGDIHYQTGAFYLDKEKDEVWFGLLPMGLVRYRIKERSSTLFGLNNGLSSGLVMGMDMDGKGRLWLSTTQGLSCFNPATESAMNYTKADGLPAYYYTSKVLYDSTLNRIYAGSPGAVTWFTVPDTLLNGQPMRILLTDVKVNGETALLPGKETLGLGPEQNNLAVKFSAINLTDGIGNRYEYRLNNGPWTDLGHQHTVRLASLKAGNYLLEVRAARKHGRYGAGIPLLHFSVRPYFTDTAWFYLICLLAAAGLIYAWYRYRLGNMRKMETMRARISRDLHDEIGSRLTNINMMGQIIRQRHGTPERDQLLDKIQEESEEISQSMREIIWDIDPQNDQLSAAMPRMLSFASQLLEARGIEVKANIGELDDLKLDMAMRRDLFLIFKEAVHNIVKHSAATKTVIIASVQGGRFRLRIEDNGKGMLQEANHHESGLRYMRQRAESHGWNLEITGLSPGTAIMLFIPGKA